MRMDACCADLCCVVLHEAWHGSQSTSGLWVALAYEQSFP